MNNDQNIKKGNTVILLHDNASHTAKLVKEMIEAFGWEILSHAAYLLDSVRLSLICIDGTRTCSAALLTKMYENG